MILDSTTTTSDSAYVRKVTLSMDDRHVVNLSEGCKDVPRTVFSYPNSVIGIIATVNTKLLSNHADDLTDISFKMAKNNYPTPSDKVISSYIDLKNLLLEKGIYFKSFSPTEDGGILLDFDSKEKYFSMELYNDMVTSIYISNRETGVPIMMDDFDINSTNEIVSAYL